MLTKCVRLYKEYLIGEEASVPLVLRGGWLVPCGGPVHSLREPGTVRVCVRLRVAAILGLLYPITESGCARHWPIKYA